MHTVTQNLKTSLWLNTVTLNKIVITKNSHANIKENLLKTLTCKKISLKSPVKLYFIDKTVKLWHELSCHINPKKGLSKVPSTFSRFFEKKKDKQLEKEKDFDKKLFQVSSSHG